MTRTDYDEAPIGDPQESVDATICPDCGEDLEHHDCRTPRIRDLNDALRTSPLLIGTRLATGELVITSGVAAKGNEFIDRAVKAVREFSDFNEDNDPYGEHDFGALTLDGVSLNWKIDCYDNALEYGSPDPADPSLTRRILTILLAEEY
jgi:hypothetical protein